MRIRISNYRLEQGESLDLARRPTRVRRLYTSEQHYDDLLEEQKKELRELQEIHYICDRYSLLFIFQAMDAAGKDGAIKHVMSGLNPQGCQVFSFRHPTPMELDHDFLWRAALALPERGRIGIFNRSYYEEVLVVRVHPEILRSQALPAEQMNEKRIWKERYRSIRDFEAHLYRNGTRSVKFFLHMSAEEQRKRLLARMDDPTKNWKVNASDIRERRFWDSYMDAYERCLAATSTSESPWYVVPADDKRNARLIIAHVVAQTLRSLDLSLQPATPERRSEIAALRSELERQN